MIETSSLEIPGLRIVLTLAGTAPHYEIRVGEPGKPPFMTETVVADSDWEARQAATDRVAERLGLQLCK